MTQQDYKPIQLQRMLPVARVNKKPHIAMVKGEYAVFARPDGPGASDAYDYRVRQALIHADKLNKEYK